MKPRKRAAGAAGSTPIHDSPGRHWRTATLADMIRRIGPELLHVVTAPRGLDVPVTDVTIVDSDAELVIESGAIALVVGVHPHSDDAKHVVEAMASQGASASCFRHSSVGIESLGRFAERAGMALIEVPRAMAWDRLHSLMLTVLGAARQGGSDGPMGVPVGDLFGLANALSAVLKNPLVIDDDRLRALAYSGQERADELRRESIVIRRIPDQWLKKMEREGIVRKLHQPDQIVRFPAWPGLTPPAQHGRVGIGIHAGRDFLGCIFVEEIEPIDAEGEAALREAARVASMHILRGQVTDEVDETIRAELTRAVLDGRISAATRLGIPGDTQIAVLAVDAAEGVGERMPTTVYRSLLPLVRLHVGSQRRHTYCTYIESMLFIVVAESASSSWQPAVLAGLAAELVKHAERSHGIALRVGISSRAPLIDGPTVRDEAVRALRSLGKSHSPAVARIDDVRNDMFLEEVGTYVLEHPHLLQGKLKALETLPRAKAAKLIDSLTAYLATGRNVPAAAKMLGLPANSLRYRVQSALQKTGLDLADPAERLVAELQLRARQTDRGSRPQSDLGRDAE